MMLLLLDRDGVLTILESVEAAKVHLEIIDIENHEYKFCDDSGQPYIGEVVQPDRAFRPGEFQIVPSGLADPNLPLTFVNGAKYFSSYVSSLKTLDDARSYFSRAKS